MAETTVAYDSFRRYVEPYATGATPNELVFNTQETLRDWCERTKCWQSLLAAFPTVAGTASYTLGVPDGAVVSNVEEVFYGDFVAEFTGMDNLYELFGENWRTVGNGFPIKATFMEPGALTLHQTPDAATNVYARVALKPSNQTDQLFNTIPLFIFEYWAANIADGVLAKLYDTPDRPYASKDRADRKTQRYEQHVAKVRLQVARSFGRTAPETKPRFF